MQCDQCQRELERGEAVFVTRSVQTGYAGPWGAQTELRHLHLCRDCARSRRGTPWFVIGVIAALVTGLVSFELILSWLR